MNERFPEIKIRTNKQELRMEFPNGSAIDFKSADREEGLRGESVNFLIVDEMGFIKRDIWQFALRGTITATNGRALFIGTPKGKNLFYELYQKGQDREETDYISFQFESRVSPYFSAHEWEQVKSLPQRVFEQEYKAHFIDSGGEVFRNISDCIGGELRPPKTGQRYYAGVDLARTVDYSVVCILNQDRQLVAFDRFNTLSWKVQKDRIISLCKRYDAHTLVDSTGVGDPIYDDLCRAGLGVESFKFSNLSKRQIVEALAMVIDRAEIRFPEIPELINELEIFTFDETSSGLIRYAAPDGMHDDIVMAMALANWAAGGQASPEDFTDSGERANYSW
jgi:phage FluMu gp28-like protein